MQNAIRRNFNGNLAQGFDRVPCHDRETRALSKKYLDLLGLIRDVYSLNLLRKLSASKEHVEELFRLVEGSSEAPYLGETENSIDNVQNARLLAIFLLMRQTITPQIQQLIAARKIRINPVFWTSRKYWIVFTKAKLHCHEVSAIVSNIACQSIAAGHLG